MRLPRQLVPVLALLLCACLAAPVQPQEAAKDAVQNEPPSKPYILHAYANLVQVPTLALDPDFNPLPPLDRGQFSIRLDSGPAFHPTRLHLQDDEPIALAILLDASGDQDRLLQGFGPALAQLAGTSLKPHDHVSLYALDCRLIRAALDIPAAPEALQSAVERALAAPNLHNGKDHGTCGRQLHTWNAAAQVVTALANLPGRRVLLLVSDGHDHHSNYTSTLLRNYADQNSISIFAIRDLTRYQGDSAISDRRLFTSEMYFALGDSPEDEFTGLCESNGGLIITLNRPQLVPGLQRFISMLRGRYILEFPRPDTHDPGNHLIDVAIPSRAAFIVTTGASFALPDATIEADPTTIHSSPSPAIIGKRHPISHDK